MTKVVADTGDGDDAGRRRRYCAERGHAASTVLTNIPLDADLGEGDDLAAGGLADDTIHGGDGDDKIFLDGPWASRPRWDGDDTGFGDAGNDAVNGGRGADAIEGGEGDDALGGGPGVDTLEGEAGADSLAAGPGADTLEGGDGDDTLTGECERQPCPSPAPAPTTSTAGRVRPVPLRDLRAGCRLDHARRRGQ